MGTSLVVSGRACVNIMARILYRQQWQFTKEYYYIPMYTLTYTIANIMVPYNTRDNIYVKMM